MYILGLSFFYHDSAACLIKDGVVVAAAQEERFSRIKHDAAFPLEAVRFCLGYAGITIDDIETVAYYEKPFTKFERIVFSHFKSWPSAPFAFAEVLTSWLSKKLRIPRMIRQELGFKMEIIFCRHHDSHAASSFFTSPFEEATIITIDGVGEWSTSAIAHGKGNQIVRRKEMRFPDSLGLVYSAFTYYLGFGVNDGEYKVMGLAPYGKANFLEQIEQMVTLHPDGSISINDDYFSYESGQAMSNDARWKQLFGFGARQKNDPIESYHKDLAASIQTMLNSTMVKICSYAQEIVPTDNLCLAGGVALNCVANSQILNSGIFKNVHVFPAAGDAGGAVGAALYAWYHVHQKPRKPIPLDSVNWGPDFTTVEIEQVLKNADIPFRILKENDLIDLVASEIQDQKVVGWFQGRMEFGPRALGNRSILADPRKKENWQRVNLKIKFRESFRPFAPAILQESLNFFFETASESSYMLFTANSKTEKIPAVVHVDGSSRIQTVNPEQNQRFYKLIKKFGESTGVPVLINTSFNTSDMPIVCTPQNAIQCFLRSNIDMLVLEDFVIYRKDIPWANTW